jgi:Tfp pilus assembly protein PilE
MKQDNKGITLITLVITVVVLTILAGVSINAVVGDDGIIAKAKESANLTKETTIKESIEKLVLEYKLAEKGETLEDFLKTKIPSKIDKVTNNGDGTLTIEKDGVTVTVNATQTSNPSTPTKPTINLDNLQIGDYVNYTYDTASDYGTVAQTIGLKWRILNIDKENNVIDIISDSPTDAKKYFGGISGYYNGSYYLNEICKAHYSNKKLGVEARSVNLLDMEKQLTSAGIEARNSYKDTYGTLYGTAQTNSIGSCYYPKLYANQIGAGINTADVTQPDITKGNDPYEESKKIATTEPVTDTTIEDASDNGLTTTQTLYEIDINETNYGKAASILISDMYWVAARYVSNSTENPFGDGEKIKSATFGIRFAGVVTGGISMLTSDPDTGSAVSEIRIRPLVSLEANLFTGMKDSSGAWNLKDSSSSNEPLSPYMDKNTEVTYLDGTVWIPEGFKIADDSASTVQGGVVIEDKDGNQFVWVPVATIDDYKRTWYTGDGSFSKYSEALPEDEKTSVETYKGFYIGRYEAGDKESTVAKTLRSSNDVTKTVTIKANQAPYNYVKRTQAVSLAEGFATKQGYKAKTKLVSSYAWDTTIAFLQKVNSDYGNSSEEGNYNDTTFSYTDITGASKTKAKNSNVLVPTGQTTPVCNIYDMGGNVGEWPTESCSDPGYPYAGRGGIYFYGFANHPAGDRLYYSVNAYDCIGFRLTLFM